MGSVRVSIARLDRLDEQRAIAQEKHIEGLIEKFTLRLEQCASGAGGEAAAEVRPFFRHSDSLLQGKDLNRKPWVWRVEHVLLKPIHPFLSHLQRWKDGASTENFRVKSMGDVARQPPKRSVKERPPKWRSSVGLSCSNFPPAW